MWTAWYVNVKIFFFIPVICSQWIGCYLNDGTKDIYVKPGLSNGLKAKVIAHEVGHACGYKKEREAQLFEKWANGEKSDRFLEYMETLNKCAKRK